MYIIMYIQDQQLIIIAFHGVTTIMVFTYSIYVCIIMTLPIESVPSFYHANNYTNLSNKREIFTISLNKLVSVTSEKVIRYRIFTKIGTLRYLLFIILLNLCINIVNKIKTSLQQI